MGVKLAQAIFSRLMSIAHVSMHEISYVITMVFDLNMKKENSFMASGSFVDRTICRKWHLFVTVDKIKGWKAPAVIRIVELIVPSVHRVAASSVNIFCRCATCHSLIMCICYMLLVCAFGLFSKYWNCKVWLSEVLLLRHPPAMSHSPRSHNQQMGKFLCKVSYLLMRKPNLLEC